jgi:NAD(P)-dependent dehydrogenase (short-subunit alcohol dehydrogenase family)
MLPPLRMGELVLITGASSGIGLATAVECAAAGHAVVATMRNLDKRAPLEEAARARGVHVDIEQLDVTHEGAGAKVRELVLKYGPFYALVNNAGIAVGGAFEEQSAGDVRDQLETNVIGVMEITRAVLPAMRAARRGRVINVSSISGRVGFPLLSVYAATKHAVEGFSEGLRWELEPFGVQVVSVEPGNVKTPIFFENQRRGGLVDKDGPYAAMSATVEKLILGGAEKAPPPEVVGAAIVKVIEAASPPFRIVVGNDARALIALRRLLPDRVFSLGMRRALRGRLG